MTDKTNNNVLQMDLTSPAALKLIRDIAADTKRVFMRTHVLERMAERHITATQVLRCLMNGHITDGPARGIKGNWELRLEVFSAGEPIAVVAALDHDDDGNYIIVITTYHMNT